MPSAKHFRLKIVTDGKTNLELSAFHLYNDSLRVDQTATVTLGFVPSSGTSSVLVNDNPVENQSLKIDNVPLFRSTQLYIIWSFAANTNVNAFRMGSGVSTDTFVDKFLLQWSDDKLNFTSFIQIAPDKKLAYPGPWALSELKALGSCFPALLRRVDWAQKGDFGFPVRVGDNSTSIVGISHQRSDIIAQGSVYPGTVTLEIPGFFKKGKYYFETSKFLGSYYGADEQTIALMMAVDTTEKTLVPEVNKKYPGFSLNNNMSFVMEIANTISPTAIVTPAADQFIPGYFSGFMIDFDTRVIKFVNPKWSSVVTGNVSFDSETTMKTIALNSNYKLFIRIGNTTGNFPGLEINFGQNAFNNTLPVGYNIGLGPRWKEVADNFSNVAFTWPVTSNSDLEPYTIVEPAPPLVTISKPILEFPRIGGGRYYIKGVITRVPALDNKKFLVQLYSVSLRKVLDECVATSSGLYEFLNIEYGPYIVTSIDLRNNTVVESIGPVYPLEIL